MSEVIPIKVPRPYALTAFNFSEDSENRIHSDEMAHRYGFKGGLVAGVGVFAYMIHPVVEAFGREWLRCGSIQGKLIKPVYHGSRVSVVSACVEDEPGELTFEVLDANGTVCAVGRAGIEALGNLGAPEAHVSQETAEASAALTGFSTPQIENYPHEPLPDAADRRAPDISAVPAGTVLGSLDESINMAELREKAARDYVETLPIFIGPEAQFHPAILLEAANHIIMRNVALGPWIHTASRLRNFAIPEDGETVSLRGSVARAFEKKGHHMVELDLAAFGRDGRPLARINHTAIIKLAGPA